MLFYISWEVQREISLHSYQDLNLKAKMWLKLGDSANCKNCCAKDCKNMRVLENDSECFPFPFPPIKMTLSFLGC